MTDQDPNQNTPAKGYWRSRSGITLIVFLAVAAILLGYEHRVHLFAGSGPLVLLLLGCGLMHLLMHGGHGGGHGGNDKS